MHQLPLLVIRFINRTLNLFRTYYVFFIAFNWWGYGLAFRAKAENWKDIFAHLYGVLLVDVMVLLFWYILFVQKVTLLRIINSQARSLIEILRIVQLSLSSATHKAYSRFLWRLGPSLINLVFPLQQLVSFYFLHRKFRKFCPRSLLAVEICISKNKLFVPNWVVWIRDFSPPLSFWS